MVVLPSSGLAIGRSVMYVERDTLSFTGVSQVEWMCYAHPRSSILAWLIKADNDCKSLRSLNQITTGSPVRWSIAADDRKVCRSLLAEGSLRLPLT